MSPAWENDVPAQVEAKYLAIGGRPSSRHCGLIRRSSGKAEA
jgi:hypothetical protein